MENSEKKLDQGGVWIGFKTDKQKNKNEIINKGLYNIFHSIISIKLFFHIIVMEFSNTPFL
ncbi:hypothetical protein [Acinetobacter sp. CS-2]|uniref:hypothetical protein n=1 Tax=Acinetobacter sp. CS-2 TaxID=2798861 RepID=UPI0019041FC6|nr:hypothetical protein [Acinetobacter sp. CS-2]QQN39125.1 hypothetical protein JFY49_14360 [Acinetobacter sp. CS-2]